MALIAYITGGFPTLADLPHQIQTLVKNGVDIIEIGIPFSDPVADGPTIQASSQAALQNGASLSKILHNLARVDVPIPLVIMSYLNPLLAYGREKLVRDAKNAGVSAVIIPDLPVEAAGEWRNILTTHDLDLIFLVAPTSSEERLQRIVTTSTGFVYCVRLTGTTGGRTDDLSTELFEWLDHIRKMTDTPLAVGFGISGPEQVKPLSGHADGVIVGSRIIKAIENDEDVGTLVRELKNATYYTR